jgi:predicted peroxiredoxin
MGHVSATEKLQFLQKLGAKVYVCHPSMDVCGVETRDLAFEEVTFAEYVSFLEVMRNATIKLYS